MLSILGSWGSGRKLILRSSRKYFKGPGEIWAFPEGIWCQNDVIDVNATSSRPIDVNTASFYVICPLVTGEIWALSGGIWCRNDVIYTSMRHHVASTFIRRHFTSYARLVIFREQWSTNPH